MEKIWKLANLYVATLRSIYFIEQHCHWASKGNDFYGNHLLFERLYKTAQENADLAAEKFIGILGPEALNYAMQTDFMNRLLNKYENYCDDLLELALTIEKDFLAFSEQAYKIFEEEKLLTLGMDDAIMSIASIREESCYLLQQALEK